MKTMTPKQKLARVLWLAFQASSPMGMGFLHAHIADAMTEDKLIAGFDPKPDDKGTLDIRTDYVAGRMMKTRFMVDADGKLTVTPEIPRYDYQSWAGRYRSASELIEDAETSPQESAVT